MTPGGPGRSFTLGIRVGIPVLLGLIAVVSSKAAGASSRSALELAALVTLGFMLVLFVIDTSIRLSRLDEHLTTGFRKIDRSAELYDLMERSFLGTAVLTDFLETAGRVDASVSPLLQRLAQREIERLTRFMRQLPIDSEITYDGEDREWLLGLTEAAQHSVDAISMSTVDAGLRGFDGGLWTSDLGLRYLDLQREAIARKVSIRRIFVFESEDLARDETFMKITQMQRDVGVNVRMLDHQLIPELLRAMMFDFIIFDAAMSYEMTPATTFVAGRTRPVIVRTLLAPMPSRVRDLKTQFEQLWDAADPERQINE
jgi:hypothetical protein